MTDHLTTTTDEHGRMRLSYWSVAPFDLHSEMPFPGFAPPDTEAKWKALPWAPPFVVEFPADDHRSRNAAYRLQQWSIDHTQPVSHVVLEYVQPDEGAQPDA